MANSRKRLNSTRASNLSRSFHRLQSNPGSEWRGDGNLTFIWISISSKQSEILTRENKDWIQSTGDIYPTRRRSEMRRDCIHGVRLRSIGLTAWWRNEVSGNSCEEDLRLAQIMRTPQLEVLEEGTCGVNQSSCRGNEFFPNHHMEIAKRCDINRGLRWYQPSGYEPRRKLQVQGMKFRTRPRTINKAIGRHRGCVPGNEGHEPEILQAGRTIAQQRDHALQHNHPRWLCAWAEITQSRNESMF